LRTDSAEHPKAPLWRRLCPVAALLILSPYCGEYLIAYGGGYLTAPQELIFGVLLMAPLYGAVAVLIREVTRRTGRGWPTILLLGCAFGVVQAGLIDQTLFDQGGLKDSPFWNEPRTLIPGLNVDAHQLLVFVGGHAIWSFGAPIALVESAFPRSAQRPWLGIIGTGVITALYLGAAALFHDEMVRAPGFRAETIQLVAAALLVTVLIAIAFALPRSTGAVSKKRPPAPLWVGATIFALLGLYTSLRDLADSGVAPWPGVVSATATLSFTAWLLWHWSGRAGWGNAHIIAAAGAPLILNALVAFAVPPMEGITLVMKYVSNGVVLALTTFGIAWITWRNMQLDEPAAENGRRS
jgi:hypothetical protein